MANSNPSNSFKPGDPRINTNGRPKKGDSWKDVIEEALSELTEENGDKGTYKQLIVKVLRKKGLSGDLKAIEMMMDRMDGKPNQKIDASIESTISDKTKEELEELATGE
jgi:hypothetical protein